MQYLNTILSKGIIFIVSCQRDFFLFTKQYNDLNETALHVNKFPLYERNFIILLYYIKYKIIKKN